MLLVATGSLASLYYYQYAQSNQRISSLQATISSLQSLLASNGTGSGGGVSTTNSSSIDTTLIYDYANASVVTVQGLQATSSFFGTTYQPVLGSGFVVAFHGSYYIVSNYHVVQNDINISVTFHDGNAYGAKVVGSDPYSDLAVLTAAGVPASEYNPLTLVASSNLKVGQQVVAIGNPYGLAGSLTEGLVSQLGRTLQDSTSGNFSIADVIQISTPINPGNSGGPLLNSRGQVVGITTAIVSGSQGIGFAIPSDTIVKELPYLITTGSYNLHPFLGIGEADMSYDLAQASHVNVTYGVLVESVLQGSPAASAGLRAGTTQKLVDGSVYVLGGDIIVSANGTRIANSDALSTWIQEHAVPGQTVQLGVVRGGSLLTVSVTLGTRPPISG
ncbi:MAG: trypsin-like peptidase domain-containing protein [Nitrososphaerota archaeon]|nr:trypsin-like peptidase domain-containing protein [Nitrososphaerota archaeon]